MVLSRRADGQLQARVTTALYLEYEAVLKRPEQRTVHGFDLDGINRMRGDLAAVLAPVEVRLVGAVETAAAFLKNRAGDAAGAGLRSFLDRVPDAPPEPGDGLDA